MAGFVSVERTWPLAKPSQRSASQLATLMVRHNSNGRSRCCCLCRRLARGICSEHSGRHRMFQRQRSPASPMIGSMRGTWPCLLTSPTSSICSHDTGECIAGHLLPQENRIEPNSSGTAISSDLAQFRIDQSSISSFACQQWIWKGKHRLGQ